MTIPTPNASAETHGSRLRRLHKRQTVVFSIIIGVMFIALFGAFGVYQGFLPMPFNRDFTPLDGSNQYANVSAPCIKSGTMPVTKYDSIHINVVNGSGRYALGGAVAEALDDRGFTVNDNLTYLPNKQVVHSTLIRFGEKGIANAYTLGAHVDSPVYLLDDRKDATVDLVVGKDFDNLIPADDVDIDATVPLKSPKGCKENVKPSPQPTLWTAPTQSPTATSTKAG